MEKLAIENPEFWKNYQEWQKNLSDKDINENDYRELEQAKNDYLLDSYGY